MQAFFEILLAIVGFIFGLGIIILIHEFGHFLFAKRAGILCYEFSLGMGPAIYKKKVGETTYAIRWIPIGGYVSMAGEEVSQSFVKNGDTVGLKLLDGNVEKIYLDPEAEASVKGEVLACDLYDEKNEGLYIRLTGEAGAVEYRVLSEAEYVFKNNDTLQIAPYNRSFESKTLLQRFLSIVAGPAMNFVLAIMLYFLVGLFTGSPANTNVLGSVTDQATGILQSGDKIVAIEGTAVTTWDDISSTLDGLLGKSVVSFEIERDGEIINEEVSPLVLIGCLGVAGVADESVDGAKILVYLTMAQKSGDVGFLDGDIITAVNGIAIHSMEDLVNVANDVPSGSKVSYSLQRANADGVYEDVSFEMNAIRNDTLSGVGIERISMVVGISPEYHFDFFYAVRSSLTSIGDVVVSVFSTFGLLFNPSNNDVGVKDLSGPIGIFAMIKQSISGGFINYLAFVGMLTVNVGLLNILPLPALDGGRIVFLGAELVSRKKVNKRVENMIHSIALILLLVLFVYISFNDVLRFF